MCCLDSSDMHVCLFVVLSFVRPSLICYLTHNWPDLRNSMTWQPARRFKWSCSLVEIHNNSLLDIRNKLDSIILIWFVIWLCLYSHVFWFVLNWFGCAAQLVWSVLFWVFFHLGLIFWLQSSCSLLKPAESPSSQCSSRCSVSQFIIGLPDPKQKHTYTIYTSQRQLIEG